MLKVNPMDYFGVEASELLRKRLFLFDMDGTVYEEDTLFDGTLQLLDYISHTSGKYVFITNNSSKSVTDYIQKVNHLGIRADRENFFTSSQATILYIKKNYPHAKVYCQGTISFIDEIYNCGIDVTEKVERVDIVLVGFDTELTTEKLRRTCEILSTQDIPFIATNPDLRCPVCFGFIPDCGSICQMITNATGKAPLYIGKPEATMVNIVREKFGYNREETVVIGDRLYTDIAAGLNADVSAICVLTGETTASDIHVGDIKPTYTYKNVKELLRDISSMNSLR